MYIQRQGLPDEGDLLLCTVTKIYENSVFVNIDDYNRSGMIHISEISPGRIRNIHEYVSVNTKVVCKVLKIDKEKGHIDLSLRRVNTIERRKKLDQIKQEQIAEKIFDFIAKDLKKQPKDLYLEVLKAISRDYSYVHPFFLDVVKETVQMKNYPIDPKILPTLEPLVKTRIKPPTVEVSGEFILKSYAPNGVEIIRTVLKNAMKKASSTTDLKYSGGGRYGLRIIAANYKDAEGVLKEMCEIILEGIKKPLGYSEFKRKES